MWKTFPDPKVLGKLYVRLETLNGGQIGGVTQDHTQAWVSKMSSFDNGTAYYLTIYYDDGEEQYKRQPTFTLPEMPTGQISIPKGGSYQIGEPTLDTFPGTGETCWKIRLKLQGGNRTYSQSRAYGYYLVKTLLPENEKYLSRMWYAFVGYMEQGTYQDNCEYAIRNGEILIQPEE